MTNYVLPRRRTKITAGRVAGVLLTAVALALPTARVAAAEPLSDPTPATVSAIQDVGYGHNRVLVFGRGPDHRIRYARPEPGATWTTVPGPRLSSGPSAVLDWDGLIVLFARRPDGTVGYAKEIVPGSWSRWRSLGGEIVGAPRAVYLPSIGGIVIAGRSPDNEVVLTTLTGAGRAPWRTVSVGGNQAGLSIQATPDISANGGTNITLGLFSGAQRWAAPIDLTAIPVAVQGYQQRTASGFGSTYAGDDRGTDVYWGRGGNGKLSYQAPWKFVRSTISITSVPTKWTVSGTFADAVCARSIDNSLWCNLAVTGEGTWFKVGGKLR